MSQEIQLSSMNPMPMQGEYIPGGGSGGGGSPTNQNPLGKLHKLLRGRYPIVIVLALIFGAIGGAAGWIMPKQQFMATGQIELSPLIRNLSDADRIMPMFNAFIGVQMQVLQSPRLIQQALGTQTWKDTNNPSSADFSGYFASNLVIDSPKNSQLITISYTDSKPNTASAGVGAVIQAYISRQNDEETREIREKQSKYETRRSVAAGNINLRQAEIQTLTLKFGVPDLKVLQDTTMSQMTQLQAQIDSQQMTYDALLQGKTPTTKPVTRVTPEQLVTSNLFMRQLVNDRNSASLELVKARLKYGESHPVIGNLQQQIKIYNDQIEAQVEAYYKQPQIAAQYNDDGTLKQQSFDPERVRQDIERFKASLEVKRKLATDVARTSAEIAGKQQEINLLTQNINEATRELDALEFRKDMLGRVAIINGGDNAVPAANKRPLIAAAGFIGGMGIPVGLMLLIGLMDSRLRYSDETDTDMSGITLLGILPNLPDRLSDPEQAATAAHCVHQIRTMLQINGAATDQSVFAVTSASPGDGKTSLTLALGLSFAACGSRTLLIDCDLIGAGLTRRLGVQSETGILEAALNRSVLEHIRTTEITDVAILPVGAGGALHASTLSPNALRRIIAEAKKHFDTILIDTGPILGSIEASLVATVADGIVLTVARGQQRQLIDKSLRHLMSIGAKICGVVFNRAQARDFERSLSNVSMRSVGLVGTVDATNRYGVLGRAVQNSNKKD